MKLVFNMDDDLAFVLGEDRVKAIFDVLNRVLDANIGASLELAGSGAHRWPISMRPEVLIEESTRLV